MLVFLSCTRTPATPISKGAAILPPAVLRPCALSPTSGNQYAYYGFEQHASTIAAGLRFLRNLTGPTVTKALIFGHSQGGPMMAFYQNVAENGPAVCQQPEKLLPCVDTDLHNLPKADGVMMFDSHLGDSLATFTYIDPAVMNNTLGQRDPSLDMFSAANGYNATTNGATYTDAFKKRYTAAQAVRNADLVSQALALLQARRASTGNPNDLGDAIPFTVVGGSAARLWQPDLSLVSCTKSPHTLLSHDGTRPVRRFVRSEFLRDNAATVSPLTQHSISTCISILVFMPFAPTAGIHRR